ncbi:MAG: homocysteine S-methyltransferase family protein [Bacteroidales bacterium]|jgi:5-methyltetrahydrofolate--homocysteine methyltransferase|nr:homocysteine S-methyltransferase family protein [Bacteroidales bacterium]MCI1733734.1 homocysteine S-methyltransferase family protein [Bacteroidales bacterium]
MERISRAEIERRMQNHILILDGGLGTLIQQRKLSKDGNMDMLNLINPDGIMQIHKDYIAAGAEIITTNTFSSTRISQKEYGTADKVYELNKRGAEIARRAAEESESQDAQDAESQDAAEPSERMERSDFKRAGYCKSGDSASNRGSEESVRRTLVAGSMGPTIKSLSLSPDVTKPEYRSISFDEMAAAFKEQAEGLIDGGADILLLESCYDGLNAEAALYAIHQAQVEKGTDIPVMVSATINDKTGRLLTGQKVEAFFTAISHYKLLTFGLNCSFGAKDLMPFVEELSNFCSEFYGDSKGCGISIYPNAGLPNEMGEYDETPEYTAACIKEVAQKGCINIAGGCCGTTPEHIRAIANALKDCKPRETKSVGSTKDNLYVSGLENLLINRKINNFINIGERTNVAGSAKFARLVREQNWGEAAKIAAKQIEDGATVIDINTDDTMLNGSELMQNFLRYIAGEPEIAKVPLMIDSSNWETILAGVKNCSGKCIVNSISLKDGEEEFVRRATELFYLGAAVIVMAFDEEGQALTYERKIQICKRAYDILTQRVGFAPSDIIFDCNILTIATGMSEHDNYAVDFIRAVRWIKENLQGAKTSGGVSNLSFAFRGNNKVREAMHSVFLYHAIAAGLDMAIVNPSMLQVYDDIEPELLARVEAVVMNDASKFPTVSGSAASLSPTELLVEVATRIKEDEFAAKENSSDLSEPAAKQHASSDLSEPARLKSLRSMRSLGSTGSSESAGSNSAEHSSAGSSESTGSSNSAEPQNIAAVLKHKLIKGDSSDIESLLQKGLTQSASPVSLIEGPLMDGMEAVGKMFGEGKMFLPQVVKSARVMQAAVNFLQPFIEKYNAGTSSVGNKNILSQPVIILATAKGDIHDIGKNIVSIILTCNNFKVIDLGVMVENQKIVDEAIKNKADLIGVSGLITPSLKQMENLAALLEENKERMLKELGYLIPLAVGGATTSAIHTAVNIAPLYSGTVVYGGDASKAAVVYKKLVNDFGGHARDISSASGTIPDDYLPGNYSAIIKHEQREIRRSYKWRNARKLTVAEARARAPHFAPDSYVQPDGYGENNLFAKNLNLGDIVGRIDWTGFFNFWGFKGKYPEVAYKNEEAEKLYDQALACVAEMTADGSAEASVMLKFFDAAADAEDVIHIYENLKEGESSVGRKIIAEIPVPRQVVEGSEYLSLADFIAPEGYTSRVGIFVLKVEDRRAEQLDHKSFEYLLRYSICARLAEALADWMQAQVDGSAQTASDVQAAAAVQIASDAQAAAAVQRLHIIRPAFGYPVCPDHSLKRMAFNLLRVQDRMDIKLTESNAIIPTTSICGMLIAHPDARFFDI